MREMTLLEVPEEKAIIMEAADIPMAILVVKGNNDKLTLARGVLTVPPKVTEGPLLRNRREGWEDFLLEVEVDIRAKEALRVTVPRDNRRKNLKGVLPVYLVGFSPLLLAVRELEASPLLSLEATTIMTETALVRLQAMEETPVRHTAPPEGIKNHHTGLPHMVVDRKRLLTEAKNHHMDLIPHLPLMVEVLKIPAPPAMVVPVVTTTNLPPVMAVIIPKIPPPRTDMIETKPSKILLIEAPMHLAIAVEILLIMAKLKRMSPHMEPEVPGRTSNVKLTGAKLPAEE